MIPRTAPVYHCQCDDDGVSVDLMTDDQGPVEQWSAMLVCVSSVSAGPAPESGLLISASHETFH